MPCPYCGSKAKVQGMNLPFSEFNYSGDWSRLLVVGDAADAKKLLPELQKMYTSEHFCRIGAFRSMPYKRFRKIYKKLNQEHDHCMPKLSNQEDFDRLTTLGGGVGLFASDHGEYLLTPSYLTVEDYTAVCQESGKKNGRWLTAYGVDDLENGGCNVLRYLASDAVPMLSQLTAQSAFPIGEQTDYITLGMAMLRNMKQRDFTLLPQEYQSFLPTMRSYLPCKGFDELVRILSLVHGSKLWVENFDRMILDKEIKADAMFTSCEELFALLTAHGMDGKKAAHITHKVRIGEGKSVVDDAFIKEISALGLPEWLPRVLCKIRRLHSKAYAVAEADILCRLLYYAAVDEPLYRSVCLKGASK